MQLYDAEGRRLYFTEDERRAFVTAAASEDPPCPAGRRSLSAQVKLGRWLASCGPRILAF